MLIDLVAIILLAIVATVVGTVLLVPPLIAIANTYSIPGIGLCQRYVQFWVDWELNRRDDHGDS